jgi:integrase
VLEQETVVDKDTKGKLWFVKTETAKRLLGRIKTVLDYATVNEYRSGTNPAQWTGHLSTQLPSPKKLQKKEHHPAVPYQQIGDFMFKLRTNPSISAKALEFLILTAVRSGSVRQAEWNEIDFEKSLWIIPPEHTKARQEHRVPLQPQAIALLKSLPVMAGSDIIFPSPRGKALSDMALSQLVRGMRERGELTVQAVPHGFRSTFRDWVSEETDHSPQVAEMALAHTISNKVEQAYRRGNLLERRRRLMVDWETYCMGSSSENLCLKTDVT